MSAIYFFGAWAIQYKTDLICLYKPCHQFWSFEKYGLYYTAEYHLVPFYTEDLSFSCQDM